MTKQFCDRCEREMTTSQVLFLSRIGPAGLPEYNIKTDTFRSREDPLLRMELCEPCAYAVREYADERHAVKTHA